MSPTSDKTTRNGGSLSVSCRLSAPYADKLERYASARRTSPGKAARDLIHSALDQADHRRELLDHRHDFAEFQDELRQVIAELSDLVRALVDQSSSDSYASGLEEEDSAYS